MFTDQPVTPRWLEVLLELVWEMRSRKLDREAIRKLLQPQGLPDLSSSSKQAMETLKAARELSLIVEDDDGSYRPAWKARKSFNVKDILLSAIDDKVLSSTEIEPWFARFYSYIITKDDDVLPPGDEGGSRWSSTFNIDLYGGPPSDNPFNKTKYTGLRRWLRYAGLGWHDAQDCFIPNPYDRIKRNLEVIFRKKKKLSADEFMSNIATNCPELDGGVIFREANKNAEMNRICTRALAIALRDLHDDKIIKLYCPADSRGWSLIRAGEIRNPSEGLYSDDFDTIELFI
jgi:hypothetical protein